MFAKKAPYTDLMPGETDTKQDSLFDLDLLIWMHCTSKTEAGPSTMLTEELKAIPPLDAKFPPVDRKQVHERYSVGRN